jgi:hypothetical protein
MHLAINPHTNALKCIAKMVMTSEPRRTGVERGLAQRILPEGSERVRWLAAHDATPDVYRHWSEIRRIAGDVGRDPSGLAGAMYLTSLDDNAALAAGRLDRYMAAYCNQPGGVMRKQQACYAGLPAGLGELIAAHAQAGVGHMILRFAGDHERHLDAVAALRVA